MKLEISIPKDLSQITLGQYQEYLKVVEANKDDDNSGDFLNLKALEIFCGMELSKTYNLPVKHFYFALQHLEKCFEEDTPLVKTFFFRDIEGKKQEMGMIPNLDNMQIGEYMDLDRYVQDWENMHRAMAVMYRPIRVKTGEKYHIDEYNGTEAYAEAMKETPLNIAMGAIVFFYRLGSKLLENIPAYLERQEGISRKQKGFLQEIGDGIRHSTHSVGETFSNQMKHQKFLYTKQ